ncbi:response regulator [Paracoccus seriniphilus]|uniref:response regulator n=1 Tax=Paracoccus seriniphilus TaxID=184748 RepID=UPI0035640335
MTQPSNHGKQDLPASALPRRVESVLIVEDHPLFCDALTIILQIVGGISSVRTTDTIENCLAILAREPAPDVIFLDLSLPDADGMDGLMQIRKAVPTAAILIVSSLHSPSTVQTAMAMGAAGFVPKHSKRQVFQDALAAIARGETYLPEGFVMPDNPAQTHAQACNKLGTLTPQQTRILALISEGMMNKQIAHECQITESTVKAHVTVIMRKLGVQSRTQAVLAAQSVRFDNLETR